MEAKQRKNSNMTPKLKLVGSPVLSRASTGKMEPFVSSEERNRNQESDNTADDDLLSELPAFERHEESTAIELFYDLFFVANLTTFSNIHEINNTKTLTSYVGFFCILWFTWCITSLYDIRFVTDSLLARIAKGVHLGVMVGLAVSGPKFDTTKVVPSLKVIGKIGPLRGHTPSADFFASFDPDGLETRPGSAILAGPLSCSRVQEDQAPPWIDGRLKRPCGHSLLGHQLVSSLVPPSPGLC